jgi:Zn-dependent metallo-hydrolase RNA specificity domain
VAGTVGAKVLAGEKVIEIDRFNSVNVNLQIKHLSFSAHADAKGILQLIRMSGAKNVLLVHGEKQKMALLKERIEGELGLNCYDPANGQTVNIPIQQSVPAIITNALYESSMIKSELEYGKLANKVEKREISGCCFVAPTDLSDFKRPRLVLMTEQEMLKKGLATSKPPSVQSIKFNSFNFGNGNEASDVVIKLALDAAFRILSVNMYVPCSLEAAQISCGDFVTITVLDCEFIVTWSSEGELEAMQALAILNRI